MAKATEKTTDRAANAAALQQALTAYFRAGCKAEQAFRIGMEVEHFVVHADGSPVDFAAIQAVLRALAGPEDREILIDGLYMGYANEDYATSLEPACQLEISIMPRRTVPELMTIYGAFRTRLAPVLAKAGLRLYAVGCHPTRHAAELPLIPKRRYAFMDRWFGTSGRHGIHMMRATASTQLSVDYFSEADFVAKFRAANLLTPLLALLCDNTPVYEAQPNARPSRRTAIWADVDPARCGIVPCLMEPDFGFARYAAWLLAQPLVVEKHGPETLYAGAKTAPECYCAPLTAADTEHVLSMFFYDVRLKNYIEIRAADSMPAPCVAAYAQLVLSIFGSRERVEAVLDRYAGATVAQIEAAKRAVCAAGYDAAVYGRPAAGELSWLLALAAPEDEHEAALLAPLAELVRQRHTIRETERSGETA